MNRFLRTGRVLVFVVIATAVGLSQDGLRASSHFTSKPCSDTPTSACFLPVSYPVNYQAEMTTWGWSSEYDDGDGAPEAVIFFPGTPHETSWEKLTGNLGFQVHYMSAPGMPLLWCDSRNYSSLQEFQAALITWGYNPALLDIVGSLEKIWTDPTYALLKGCLVGQGRLNEAYVQQSDFQNLVVGIGGVAKDVNGAMFDVAMRLKFQFHGPSVQLQHVFYNATPKTK